MFTVKNLRHSYVIRFPNSKQLFINNNFHNKIYKMSIGVPIKLLHEAENHVVTVELKTGELFRGYLMEAEVYYIK